jgi:hypothetical protein
MLSAWSQHATYLLAACSPCIFICWCIWFTIEKYYGSEIHVKKYAYQTNCFQLKSNYSC